MSEVDPHAAPLAGITVLDLTRVLSGPFCTMLLADMGARVLKVERPRTGDDTRAWGPPFVDGESAYFLSINRNKESVTLDFKRPDGRRVLDHLIARADVIVENFRPGTLAPLNLDYDALKTAHPRLVYCSISGFGHTGPRRMLPGYDAIMQAEGGLMSITGDAEGPPFRLGVAIADLVSGLFAAHGIALALIARGRTGRGQFVDVAMLDSVAALLTYQAASVFATGRPPERMGNRHPMIVPYETFEASDGEFVLAVGNDDQWRRMCRAAGRPDLEADQRYSTNARRVAQREELCEILAGVFKSRTRDAWIERLTEAGVPAGSVRTVEEVLRDPQIVFRRMVETLTHPSVGLLKVLGVPVKLSDTPGAVRTPPPRLGEHTRAILTGELGVSPGDYDRLSRDGVI